MAGNHLSGRAARSRFAAGVSLLLAACHAGTAELTGYGILTSDYVFRGVSYSDGHGALQAAADVALNSGLYFGLWASSVDLKNGATRQRDLQVNYYLGFSRPLDRKWLLGMSAVAYTFPDTEGNVDYDYEEYSLALSYDDRLWLEYAWSPDLFHTGSGTHNAEIYAELPLPAQLVLGAGAGYYDVSELAGTGYGYWQIGLTRPIGPFDLDLRYHDTNRPVPIVSSYQTADARIALSAKFTF